MTTTTQRAPARELTDWFPAHMQPVREGVYELINPSTGMHFFARWFRQRWCVGSLNLEWAAAACRPSVKQGFWPWRGLQGDEHSLQIGSNMYLVEFSEGPDRPGDDK